MSSRKTIPKETREKVYREFNYRCAVCGADRPHIHHIDEDPSNNDPNNLLPLCPNCHLTDHHDPTKVPEPLKLTLLRLYKDPAVLSPQFHPLYLRVKFLEDVTENCNGDALQRKAEELISFVSDLEMGKFYSERILVLLISGDIGPSWFISGTEATAALSERAKRWNDDYCLRVMNNRLKVYELVVEMLRYQRWSG